MARLLCLTVTLMTLLGSLSCRDLSPDALPQSELGRALQNNGYFSTLEAIQRAGGLDIYREEGSSARTIFAPTEAAWANFATTLGYASPSAMIKALDPLTLKAILQYNCLRTPESFSNLGSATTWTTCFALDGFYTRINTTQVQDTLAKQTRTALRDAACNVIPFADEDILAGENILHGLFDLAIPPGTLDIVTMLLSNPVINTQIQTYGNEAIEVLSELSLLEAPFTYFIPTEAAIQNAITQASPSGLGLLPEQISTWLKYQVATTQVTPSTFGNIPTLAPGRFIAINSVGFPPSQSAVVSDNPQAAASTILQANNASSDGNNIYCLNDMLIPQFPGCQAKTDTTTAETFCQVSNANESQCLAVTIETYDGNQTAGCAFTPAGCVVDLDNEAFNCAQFLASDPSGGSVCLSQPNFCTWVPAVCQGNDSCGTHNGQTACQENGCTWVLGECNPVGGAGTDAIACGSNTLESVCNSIVVPATSMCIWLDAICEYDADATSNACSQLNNTDCVSTSGNTALNADFCEATEL